MELGERMMNLKEELKEENDVNRAPIYGIKKKHHRKVIHNDLDILSTR